jgi:hypothetical protein
VIWTDENMEIVKTMWLGGHSATLIGRQFGVTRNTIIGKVSRMGWVREKCTIPLKDSATWTDEMDARLKRMAGDGASRSTMAVDLGLTYNQVLSRCRVLKLKVKDGRVFTLSPFTGAGRSGAENSRRMKEFGIAGAPARIVDEAPDPTMTGLTILQMPNRGACRWPISGSGAGMIMCGAQCGEDTYCGSCRERAYIAPTQSAARSIRSLERGVRRHV